MGPTSRVQTALCRQKINPQAGRAVIPLDPLKRPQLFAPPPEKKAPASRHIRSAAGENHSGIAGKSSGFGEKSSGIREKCSGWCAKMLHIPEKFAPASRFFPSAAEKKAPASGSGTPESELGSGVYLVVSVKFPQKPQPMVFFRAKTGNRFHYH